VIDAGVYPVIDEMRPSFSIRI